MYEREDIVFDSCRHEDEPRQKGRFVWLFRRLLGEHIVQIVRAELRHQPALAGERRNQIGQEIARDGTEEQHRETDPEVLDDACRQNAEQRVKAKARSDDSIHDEIHNQHEERRFISVHTAQPGLQIDNCSVEQSVAVKEKIEGHGSENDDNTNDYTACPIVARSARRHGLIFKELVFVIILLEYAIRPRLLFFF